MTEAGRFPKVDDKTVLEQGDVFAPAFDAHGLLPVIVTAAGTGEVLLFAHMNEEALALSIETGEVHFWSRSRKALWRKGETSGNTLRIVEIRIDCDQDVLWVTAELTGAGACCHTGRISCFYRGVPFGSKAGEPLFEVHAERHFDPAAVYGDLSPKRKR